MILKKTADNEICGDSQQKRQLTFNKYYPDTQNFLFSL